MTRISPSPTSLAFLLALLTAAAAGPAPAQDAAAQADGTDVPEAYRQLEFREIGPAITGGRIVDVEALPEDPSTVYVAAASGGLWKSTNAGTTWTPIFDHGPVSAFGDLAVAPSDRRILYAGTGEQNNRQSTSWGNGVYRSDDGGESWTHLGLVETRHVAEVRVHPEDPDVAWVAAQGNLWKPTPERGVYRTTDGGETWRKTLYVDTLTGATDLAVDPRDPSVLYAATYQRLRRTWGFNGGGPGSGIWKSTDGGESWTELTEGLPEGDKGRIGLAVAPSDPDVVYAVVEHAEDGGTYRSDDAGATWRKVNDLNPRPMYYSHIFVDPASADRVYVLATEFYMSEDGGSTFVRMPTRPTYDVGVHSDHHTLWIDPNDTEHFYLAGDAGLHVTEDRGETYRRINNFGIAQFYAIGLDRRDPYRIYGGLQDNHSFMGPSATRWYMGIQNDDWKQIGFGDGMYQQPDPSDYRYTYVLSQNGGIVRFDPETGDRLPVEPAEPEGEEAEEYRFDWVTPAKVSHHDPTTVYLGGNRLFVSRDRGVSWERTEDLTKAIDRDTLSLMGVPGDEPMLSKHDGTASYSEITTISESPLDADVLWVGTDDGNVQVSRDGGESWTEVGRNVDGVEPTTYVSRVTASGQAPGVAYAAFDAHRRGDFRPYLYRTEDFGETWTPLHGGLPEAAGSVNDVIEHPDEPRLLFLGTEHHLYVSTDAGSSWERFGANLPTTLYDDLAIHPEEDDLVAGTHGRGIWILDELSPLVEEARGTADPPALHAVRPATIFEHWKATSYRAQAEFHGENPPHGAVLSYRVPRGADSARIELRDADGNRVRTLDVPADPGAVNRVVWDLRHEPPPEIPDPDDDEEEEEEEEGTGRVVAPDTVLPALPYPQERRGPFVAPGVYTATLVAGGGEARRSVEVRGDPELRLDDDWHDREAFLLELLEMQRRVADAAGRALALAEADTTHRELAQRLRFLGFRMSGLAGDFNRTGVTQPTLHPPTETHRELKARLEEQLEAAVAELEEAGG